jgi:hypothetical protein
MSIEEKRENARRVHQLLGIKPRLAFYEVSFLEKIALIRRGKLSSGQQRVLDGIYSRHFGPQADKKEVQP